MADVQKQRQSTTDTSRPSSKNSGVRIGPYILGKTLGIGSTGKVKLGIHSETNQRVAIKIINKHSLKKEKQQPQEDSLNKKLEREIAIMKLVQHPNVMSLYDVFESQDELFLVLELIEGGELFDYLVKQGRLKEQEALAFFHQIIAGLDYCHKHLICHRDLKPENLLLDSQRNIKLADFGMASLQVTGKMLETSCGSPHYASPEIIKGIKYDGSGADIWSTGIILYALLTGNLPFDDENIRKLLQKVKTGIYSIPDHVPADAADLIRRMLVVNPQQRITMPEIIKHPWFNKRPYTAKSGGGPLDSSSFVSKPLSPQELQDIDQDILNSLRILGYGTDEQIFQALQASQPNYEKVFYHLLMKRRNEYLETYEPEKDWWYNNNAPGSPGADAKSARRRVTSQSSRASLLNDRASVYGSSNNSAGELPALINPNGGKKNTSGDTLDESSSKRQSTSPNQKYDDPLRKRNTQEAVKHKSFNPSPLSVAVVGQNGAFNNDLAEKAREAALKALEGRRAPSPDILQQPGSPQQVNKRASVFEQFKLKLNLGNSTNSLEPEQVTQSLTSLSGGRNSASANSRKSQQQPNVSTSNEDTANQQIQDSQGTPKFHRKHLDVSSSNKSVENQPTSEDSPGISSGPKKSWFHSLFQFKPETFTVYSHESLHGTRDIIERLLQRCDVQYQQSSSGVAIKCKYDNLRALPPVKFKVQISRADSQEPANIDLIEVVCTQQQGALSSFMHFSERFKQLWPAATN